MAENEARSDHEEFVSPERRAESRELTPPRLPRKARVRRRPVHTAACPWNPSRRLVFSSQEDKSPVRPKPSKKRKRIVKRRHRGRTKKQRFETRDLDVSGTWVQCTNRECRKWRYLSDVTDPSQIPDIWTCEMNSDTSYNSCQLPEQDYSSLEFVHSKFTEGSLVWAKMQGFPWWPAMIEEDPDNELCLYPDPVTGEATDYHVIFLDKKVTRCWLKASNIQKYEMGRECPGSMLIKGRDYTQKMSAARENADKAVSMSIEERIKTYGLSATFRGSWGDDASSSSQDSQPRHELKAKKMKKERREHRAVNEEGPAEDSLLSHSDMDDILDEAEALLEEVHDIVMEVEEEVKEDLLQEMEADELLSETASGDGGTEYEKKRRSPKKSSSEMDSSKVNKGDKLTEKDKMKEDKKELKRLRKLAEMEKMKQEKEELKRLRKLEKEVIKEKKKQEAKELREKIKQERRGKKDQEKMERIENKEEKQKEKMEKKEKQKQQKKERKEMKKQAKKELASAGGDENESGTTGEKTMEDDAEKQARKEKKHQEKAERKKLKKEQKEKKRLESQNQKEEQDKTTALTVETGKVKPSFHKPKKVMFTAPTQKASAPLSSSPPVLAREPTPTSAPQCDPGSSSVRRDISALLSEMTGEEGSCFVTGETVGGSSTPATSEAHKVVSSSAADTNQHPDMMAKKLVRPKFSIKTKDGHTLAESGMQNPVSSAGSHAAPALPEKGGLGSLDDEVSVDIGKILEVNREQDSPDSPQDGRTAQEDIQVSESSDPLAFPLSQMTGKQLEPVSKTTSTEHAGKSASSIIQDGAAPAAEMTYRRDESSAADRAVREPIQPEIKSTAKLNMELDVEEFSPDVADWSEPDGAQLVPGQKTVLTTAVVVNGDDSEDSDPFDMEE